MADIKILPITYNLEIMQGADWSHSTFITDDNDQVFDLTGYTAKMQIRDRAGGNLIKEISSPSNGITITTSTGEIALTLTNTETADIAFTRGVWDLLITSPSGTKTYPFTGEVKITSRVTI